jgi:3-hydroxyisobutyrate dehydrogenase
MTTVAFLGLGRMGAPMATAVAAAGHQVVLYNRTREKAERLGERIEASVAGSPREAAAKADVVITMLADEQALLGVLDGDEGVLAGLRRGAVVVDMGTTGPGGVRRVAGRVLDAGGTLVDAPVSGSTGAAEAAALTVMVGGPEDSVNCVRPVLESMSKAVYHLGGVGAGSVVKLAVNNIIYALGNAVAESLVLAERAGIDRAKVYDVFENSAIAAPMVKYRHDAFLDPERTPAAFAMKLAEKDLALIAELAESVHLPMTQARANLELIGAAVDAGLGERDMADVAVYLREELAASQ